MNEQIIRAIAKAQHSMNLLKETIALERFLPLSSEVGINVERTIRL